MRWTERQQAMLEAMGLRLWTPAGPARAASAGEPDRARPDARAEPVEAEAQAPSPSSSPRAARAAPLTTTLRPAGAPEVPAAPAASVASIAAPVALGPRPDVATLGWTALREAVAGCRACSLCNSRTQTVFGTGSEQAQWMVVGEAPGEQEDRQGEPFVGPAGQLLDRMLAALHLTRAADAAVPPAQRVYIANTLKCRPPRNRNPEPAELAQCEPYLARQVALLEPRLILAMGRFAVRALLGSEEPIGRLRGRVHHYRGVPLVVTYHPAYLLRNLPDKARAWEDLCLAAQVAEAAAGPGQPTAPPGRLQVGSNP